MLATSWDGIQFNMSGNTRQRVLANQGAGRAGATLVRVVELCEYALCV